MDLELSVEWFLLRRAGARGRLASAGWAEEEKVGTPWVLEGLAAGVFGAVCPCEGVYSPQLAPLLAGAMPPALLGTVVAPGVRV